MENIICPVSPNKVQEHVTRLTALMIVLTLLTFIASGLLFFLVIAILDFAARAFKFEKYSIFNRLSNLTSSHLNIVSKELDKAPKIFAARLGFIFTFSILILTLLEAPQVALALTWILISLALMESMLKICVGCYIYSWFVLPFYKS